MSAREAVVSEAIDTLETVAKTAQKAAVELLAASRGIPEDPAGIARAAETIAAESHRLAVAALNTRATASRLAIVSLYEKGASKR